MTFAEDLTPPERERLTNRITLLNAAASVMLDKPCGSTRFLECPVCSKTAITGKTKRGDIIARCLGCGTTTWEVDNDV